MLTGLASIVGVLAAAILFLGVMPLVFRETRRARAVDRRLSNLRGRAVVTEVQVDIAEQHGADAPWRVVVVTGLRALSMIVPVGAAEREKLDRMLRKGGFGQPEALSVYLCIKLACALALAILAVLVAAGVETIAEYDFALALAALVGFVIGGIFPEYGLRSIANQRMRRMQSVLPDALDMLVMCLETGLTVERGMITVAEEMVPIEPKLANEFRQIEAELRLGSDRRAVLEEYHRRTEIPGLGDFAMALIQSDRYGTPLSQAMKSIAKDERLQKAARIATQAERLPVLMTLPMLLFVVPGTMALVAGPGFLTAIGALGKLSAG